MDLFIQPKNDPEAGWKKVDGVTILKDTTRLGEAAEEPERKSWSDKTETQITFPTSLYYTLNKKQEYNIKKAIRILSRRSRSRKKKEALKMMMRDIFVDFIVCNLLFNDKCKQQRKK